MAENGANDVERRDLARSISVAAEWRSRCAPIDDG
jgi:hypothetical protein